MSRPALATLLLLLTHSPTPCLARVEVSFPLEGYYRPGEYMPVRVVVTPDANSPPPSLSLTAPGTVTTRLELTAGRADAVVPWLALRGTVRDAVWSLPGVGTGPIAPPPRPLDENDRLVGLAGGDGSVAAGLFTGHPVIPVRLDPVDPLPGPPAAWESLDALVLDGPAVAWLTERRLASLLAAGSAVAVRAPARPGGDWPWCQQGDYWVVTPDLVGPRGAINGDIYAPAYGRTPGWPAPVRRQAIVLAIIFSLLALGLSLWRSRWAAAAVLGLSLVALAGIAFWSRRQEPVVRAGGAVVTIGSSLTQQDDWTYHKSLLPADARSPWPDGTSLSKPVFFSPAHAGQLAVRLGVAPDGRPRGFAWRIAPGQTLAVLTRSVRTADHPGGTVTARVTSPIGDIARSSYLRPGVQVRGQTVIFRPADNVTVERWPDVVLEVNDGG